MEKQLSSYAAYKTAHPSPLRILNNADCLDCPIRLRLYQTDDLPWEHLDLSFMPSAKDGFKPKTDYSASQNPVNKSLYLPNSKTLLSLYASADLPDINSAFLKDMPVYLAFDNRWVFRFMLECLNCHTNQYTPVQSSQKPYFCSDSASYSAMIADIRRLMAECAEKGLQVSAVCADSLALVALRTFE